MKKLVYLIHQIQLLNCHTHKIIVLMGIPDKTIVPAFFIAKMVNPGEHYNCHDESLRFRYDIESTPENPGSTLFSTVILREGDPVIQSAPVTLSDLEVYTKGKAIIAEMSGENPTEGTGHLEITMYYSIV